MTCSKLILAALLLLTTTPMFALAEDRPLPEVYEVSISCFKDDNLITETEVRILGGGFTATIQNSFPKTGDDGKKLESPSTVILIDSRGPLVLAPDLTNHAPAVEAAMQQAQLARLGPLNFWFYCLGANRYEIEVKQEQIIPGDWGRVDGDPVGWVRRTGATDGPFELLGTLRGRLPETTELGFFTATGQRGPEDPLLHGFVPGL